MAEKRNKAVVRKLTYLKTSRMLKILGYRSTENDSKRLEYAIASFGTSKLQDKTFGDTGLEQILGVRNAEALEQKMNDLQENVPKIDNDL
jgi:hypothetical protein